MKKHFKTIALCLTCVLLLIYGILATKKQNTIKKVEGYKQILELWHIDSFEGGIGSRKDFLLKTSLSYEKKNKVLVSVVSHTISSATIALKNKVPDMISCGNGLDIAQYLLPIATTTEYNVCSYQNKSYGVAWAKGGYALIGSGEKTSLIVSQAEYTQPLLALQKSGISFKEIKVLPPSKAYLEYILKGGYLLGTQRDIYRLTNKGLEVEYQPIGGYCDLFQVIGITTQNKQKLEYCQSFLEHLLSKEVQSRLTEIGLMSTIGLRLYQGEVIQKLEEVEIKEFTSFLTSSVNLKQMQAESLSKLQMQGQNFY